MKMNNQMMTTPSPEEEGVTEEQLLAVLKQAKALADQNGMDFQALVMKVVGGKSLSAPPPPSAFPVQ
jgi:hypothetical protein